MAVNPLYSTKADFLKQIRLSTADDVQTLAVIDIAISKIRLEFFKRLGDTRALEIAAFTGSENPTTEDEILKSYAAVAEVLWTTAFLIDLLPHVFMEGEAGIRQGWNEEPLSRDASELAKFKQSLLDQVDSFLGMLEIPENTNSGPNKCFSAGRETPFILQNVIVK